MLKFVKNYDYKEEKVNLVAGYNDDKCIASMCELLHIDKEDVKGVTSFFTAGKLSFKKLYLVDLSNIKDSNDLIPIFKKIAAIEEDIKILADTFKKNFELEDIVSSLTETLTTTTYSFDELKSTKQQKKEYTVEIYSKDDMEEYFQKGIIYGEGINQARDLVNKPYNYLNATDLANIATKLGKEANIEVTVYNKEQIEELNMGMFLAVNKGSYDEPKLIVMKYQGLDTFENPCALVGKGVMFDTGGYSLKSPVSMPGMKTDMAGAAAVINAISIIARRKRKANVMAVVAATDNRIDSLAIVPDDIITSMNGKTVEIKSTDAEGRLTLGDAVWFAQTKEHAKKVIDVATLTGAN